MDYSALVQAISSVGFPIVMCLLCMYYVKYMSDQHKEEIDKMSEALNNNTLAIERLVDKLGGDFDAKVS